MALLGLKHDLHPECSGIFNLKGFNPKGCGQGRGILLKRRHDKIGTWLSLVERCVRDAEVAGSNPVVPIKFSYPPRTFIPSGIYRLKETWGPSQLRQRAD